MDNQHRHIGGYRELDAEEISLINDVKSLERRFAELRREVLQRGGEPRNAALARTYGEEAFSRLVKAVAKPDDPFADYEAPAAT